MTDKKQEFTVDVLIADVMLRITVLEKMLIDKGLLTQAELIQSTEEIAQKLAKVVLEKAQSSKDVGDFINNLENMTETKKEFNN